MAASLSQHFAHAGGGSTATSVSITTSATAWNDTWVLFLCLDRAPTTTPIVNGHMGATAFLVDEVDATPTLGAYVYVFVGFGVFAAQTNFTVSWSGAAEANAALQIWSGARGLITHAISAATTSASPITPSVASTDTDQGVAGFIMQNVATSDYTSYTDTPGSWTVDDSNYDAGATVRVNSAHRVTAEVATQQHQGNGGPNSEWVSASVVLGGTEPVPSVQPAAHTTSLGLENPMNLTAPTGRSAGDLLICALMIGNQAVTPSVARWTLLLSVSMSTNGKLWIYYRTADATTNDNFSASFGGTSVDGCVSMVAYTGATGIEGSTTNTANASASVATVTQTTLSDETTVLSIYAQVDTNAFGTNGLTLPTAIVRRLNTISESIFRPTASTALAYGDERVASAGTTTTARTATVGGATENWAAVAIAIRSQPFPAPPKPINVVSQAVRRAANW